MSLDLLLKQLSKYELELLKEAEYQNGGMMMVDGSTMERLLEEVSEYRQQRFIPSPEEDPVGYGRGVLQ